MKVRFSTLVQCIVLSILSGMALQAQQKRVVQPQTGSIELAEKNKLDNESKFQAALQRKASLQK